MHENYYSTWMRVLMSDRFEFKQCTEKLADFAGAHLACVPQPHDENIAACPGPATPVSGLVCVVPWAWHATVAGHAGNIS
jgi:hypothetical protein